MAIRTAAVLSINEPGEMGPAGRQMIADWLRHEAKNLLKNGPNYASAKYRAWYKYDDEETP